MPSPIGLAVKLALTPTGRKMIRLSVQAARSEQGRKAFREAGRVATGPEARRRLRQAGQIAKKPVQAATAPQTRERLSRFRDRVASRKLV